MSAFCCFKPSAQTEGNLVNQAKFKQKDTRKSEYDLITMQHNTFTSSQLLSTNNSNMQSFCLD
jgi:hypothetical protein